MSAWSAPRARTGACLLAPRQRRTTHRTLRASESLRDESMNKPSIPPNEKQGHPRGEQQESRQERDIEIPAIRHIGPTLESDPEYLDAIGSGAPTPEAQIAEEASRAQPDLRRLMRKSADPLSGRQRDLTRPEPLKTRLPGDTSSDPHTDVGPDNATNLQHRGERRTGLKRHAA